MAYKDALIDHICKKIREVALTHEEARQIRRAVDKAEEKSNTGPDREIDPRIVKTVKRYD